MTNYEKLVEKLKEVEEIKEDLEELRFGTKIIWNWLCYRFLFIHIDDVNFFHILQEATCVKTDVHRLEVEKIKNDLEERHLRMYCENKNINYSMHKDWFWIQYKWVIKIDNTKDFNNQSEEVYQKIYEALISL